MNRTTINNGDTGAVVRTALNGMFEELYSKRASDYGFSTTNSADDNVTALQNAVTGGGRIYIDAGTYDLNDTILLDSNTEILCERGTTLNKSESYSLVFMNRGALTEEWNENISIKNINVQTNGTGSYCTVVHGMDGHIGFYYIKNLLIENFQCLDIGSTLFTIVIHQWENVVLNNIKIEGDKDGIHFGPGHGARVINYTARCYDDGVNLNGIAYPSHCVIVGDIYDIKFIDCCDEKVEGQVEGGAFLKMMGASWTDWGAGNTYKTGNITKNAGKLYQCNNDNGFSGTAADAPTHDIGEVTGGDGIVWRYKQEALDKDYVEIYDIQIIRGKFTKARFLLNPLLDGGDYLDAVYPGTEGNSTAYDITVNGVNTLNNILVSDPRGMLIELKVINSYLKGISYIYYNYGYSNAYNTTINIILSNNMMPTGGNYVRTKHDTQHVQIFGSGNYHSSSGLIYKNEGEPSTFRINNESVILNDLAELNKLTPDVGDLCRTPAGLWIYKAGGWVNLAV